MGQDRIYKGGRSFFLEPDPVNAEDIPGQEGRRPDEPQCNQLKRREELPGGFLPRPGEECSSIDP